ncbi:ribonuclease III [Xinfangfangia sp. D13-10-4-6]|nr:ribonuclease III [Pseudogemmobacter hezensis]
MRLSADLRVFQTRIGYEFSRTELLVRAVTHPSIATPTRPDNQRLEFLGDRVLGLVMAEALLAADKSAREGQLAPRFNALVRKEACAEVAREIGLGEVLRLGRSEMLSGGRRKEALLGDATEALIAAVYLDAGFDRAKELVLRLWGKRISAVEPDARDAKSALQEWAQARGMTPPVYTETARTGPDHQPLFTVRVLVGNGASEEATGGSKRAAEQLAAAALLRGLETGDASELPAAGPGRKTPPKNGETGDDR